MKDLIIEIASPIDRENLVAEVWLNNELIAELNTEKGFLEIEIYTTKENRLTLNYEDFLEILSVARKKLGAK